MISWKSKIITVLLLIVISSNFYGCIEKQDENKYEENKYEENKYEENKYEENTNATENVSILDLVKNDAIKRFNFSEKNIEILSIIPVEWTDTSLGYPEPKKVIGKDYSIDTIQGYVIIIRGDGKLYEYHSDGRRIVSPDSHIKNIISNLKNDIKNDTKNDSNISYKNHI